MEKMFTEDFLEIGIWRNAEGNMVLSISSDYSDSRRKQRLFVDNERLCRKLEETRRAIKTRLLQSLSVEFHPEDYYDSMVNIYQVPYAKIGPRMKRAKIGFIDHGSIPKEWSIHVTAIFDPAQRIGPFNEVLTQVLGSLYTEGLQEKFKRDFRKVTQVKKPA